MRTPRWLVRIGDLFGLTPDRGGFVRLALLMAAVLLLVAWAHPGRADRALRHVVTWGLTIVLLLLLARGAWQLERADASKGVTGRFFLSLFLVVAGAALFVPPFQSTDVYAYANAGQLQVGYGLDPYVHSPSDVPDFEDDPMLSGMWQENTCVYGFAFAHVARGLTWLGGGDLALTVVLFKVWNVALLLLTGAVLLGLAGRAGHARPERAVFWLLLSPFVVLQGVSHAHNDVLLGLLVLLAVGAAITERWLWVLPALALGVLVKLTPVVAAPFALVFLVRRYGWRRSILSALLALGVVAAVSLPYVLDLASFPLATIGADFARPSYSLHAAFVDAYAALADAFPVLDPTVAPVARGTQLLLALGYVVFIGLRFVRALRLPTYDARAFLADTVFALFALLFLASSKFAPWYILMVLPAALLLTDDHPLRGIVVWLSITWMLVFTGIGKSRILDALVMTGIPLAIWCRRQTHRSPDPSEGGPQGALDGGPEGGHHEERAGPDS